MHMLHLLRHAKSSWKEDVEDHERPLSRRGQATARRVGKHLPAATGALDLVLCSSALRTCETLELVLAGFAVRPHSLIEDRLYLADRAKLIDRLRLIDEAMVNVLVIGHNPGLHDLAVALAETGSPGYSPLATGKFPTGVRASFRVSTPWAALAGSRWSLVDYVTPRSLADEED
jgi:phosphohistidine phosphatase